MKKSEMNRVKVEQTGHDGGNSDFIPTAIEAPGNNTRIPKEPIKLVFETVFLILAFLPMTIWAIIVHIFAQRKSVAEKVVVVTGSGRGLGRGFVEEFGRLGCKVACVDIDPNLNQETVDLINEQYPGRAKGYICNVALPAEIHTLKEEIIKDFGQVNIFVHNAGVVGGSVLWDCDDQFIYNLINVNLTSHFLILREFLPDMIRRNEGHYVAVGSIASFNAVQGASLYVAAKHGLLGLMSCLQYDLDSIPDNKVRASIVCPYFVNTSTLYARYWSIRIPELSIKYTVKTAVGGILKNRKIITIPANLYYVAHFLKFAPEIFMKLFSKVFYVKISMPPTEELKKFPLFHHLKQSIEKCNQNMKI